MCDQECPRQVGVEHQVPLGRRDVGSTRRSQQAGVVDKHVDVAELVDRAAHHRGDGGRPSHVDALRSCDPAGASYPARGRPCRRPVDVAHDDPTTLGRQALGDGTTDPAPGPGHDGGPTHEASGHVALLLLDRHGHGLLVNPTPSR